MHLEFYQRDATDGMRNVMEAMSNGDQVFEAGISHRYSCFLLLSGLLFLIDHTGTLVGSPAASSHLVALPPNHRPRALMTVLSPCSSSSSSWSGPSHACQLLKASRRDPVKNKRLEPCLHSTTYLHQTLHFAHTTTFCTSLLCTLVPILSDPFLILLVFGH